MRITRRIVELGVGVVLAAALIGVGVLTIGSRHSTTTRQAASVSSSPTGPTPYPDAMRIPIDMYEKVGSGVVITPADVASQPTGSIVAQSLAEAAAKDYAGAGTTIYGTALANVSGLSADNPPGLYWIVSVDPGSGALRHANGGQMANFFDVFVSTSTGKVVQGFGADDPSYPPFANSANDPTLASAGSGLTTN